MAWAGRLHSDSPWILLAAICAIPLVILACVDPLIGVGVIAGAVVVVLALVRPKTFFLLGMFILLLQRTLSLHVGGGIVDQFDEIFVAACAVLFSTQRLLRGQTLRVLPGQALTVIFILIGLAGCVVNSVPLGVSLQGALLIVKGFVLAWGVAQLDWATHDVEQIAKAAATFAVLLIVGGVINFVAPGPWSQVVLAGQDYGSRFGLAPITSFFQHPGYFGSVMAMTLLAALAFQSVFRRTKTSILLVFGSLFAAFLTGRRKVLIGLVAGVSVLGLRLRMAPLLIVAVLAVPLSLLVFWNRIVEVVQYTWAEYFVNPDAVARIRLTIDSFTIAAQSFPFGAGFGRFGSAVARQNYSPLYYELSYNNVWGLGPTEESGQFLTDTFWPAIIGESGFIGAACFIAVLVVFVRRFGLLSRQSQGWDRWLGLVGLAWTVQMTVESVAGAVFTAVPTFALFFGLVGIVATRPKPEISGYPTGRVPSRAPWGRVLQRS
ncbi:MULTISPECIES: O-antigen ligase family protein [Microbacterium]|uniref:O-antigen ligase domain-containing protein n=1 Tax=Microbacterium wangchenii TaxID=2541726 RepID=A0ABX5SRC8_9MICO|nr:MULTISPECIES: hypothetical protein [Microbacterium]MCK6068106.1 hypothetical protein [Microbacterium sp. EYE_512]QBR87772.1 hypothetical protein E4K62_03080 [Microbacterium wangchenii]